MLGFAECTNILFESIGSSLSIMALALISGLEAAQTQSDWRVKSICTTAISQLLWQNRTILSHSDKRSVIWELFFGLGQLAEKTPILPDRIAIIRNLKLLVSLFYEDKELSTSITKELLSCDNKTINETALIKETVLLILDTTVNPPNNAIAPSSKNALDLYYSAIFDLIDSQKESCEACKA